MLPPTSFLAVFIAFSFIFITSLYIKYIKKEKKCPVHYHQNKVKISENDNNDQFEKFVLSLNNDRNNEILLNEALNIADQIVKNAKNCKISTEIKLSLYGLFKQSEFGDIEKKEPSKLNVIEHSKWSAWNKYKGKTKLDAKFEYFQLVYIEIVKKFNLKIGLFKDDNNNDNNDDNNNNGGGHTMNFAVNSKIRKEEFNESLHGNPNELFNKFDLTLNDINININDIRKYIISNSININKQNENGTTFLNFAVDNNKYDIVLLLIKEFNANINLSDDMGYTPLHSAVLSQNIPIIKLLLENGANINAKSFDDNELPSDLTDSQQIKQLLINTKTNTMSK